MRKNLLILLVIITTQLLTSCGSCSNRRSANNEEARQDKTVLVKPYSKEVKGYLSDVLEVVDGEYKLNYSAEMFSKVSIQVKVKSIGVGNPNDHGFKDGNDGPLYIVICDKNGAPIAKIPELASSFENDGLLKDMMRKKDENWISFEAFINNALPEGAATFIISSKEIQPDESRESSSLEDDNDVSSDDTEKWDKVLDDYEEYVDKTIAIMKKMKRNHPIDAALDYPALIKKSKELQESLDEAKSSKSLTPEQMERMAKIHLKALRIER
jgi:hypothetical protein